MRKIEWTTTVFSGNKKSRTTDCAEFHPDQGLEKQLVNLHPQVTYQEFQGFGGACILLVTHDAKVAARAQRVLFMKDGRVKHELPLAKSNGQDMESRAGKVISQMKNIDI